MENLNLDKFFVEYILGNLVINIRHSIEHEIKIPKSVKVEIYFDSVYPIYAALNTDEKGEADFTGGFDGETHFGVGEILFDGKKVYHGFICGQMTFYL